MGLGHPDMTPQLAAQLLPDGFLLPLALARQLGALLNPASYAATPARTLIQLCDQLDAALDLALRQATTPSTDETAPPPSPPQRR